MLTFVAALSTWCYNYLFTHMSLTPSCEFPKDRDHCLFIPVSLGTRIAPGTYKYSINFCQIKLFIMVKGPLSAAGNNGFHHKSRNSS